MPVWLRIVWARRSASTTASTVSPTRSRPWSVPRWTIRPPTGLLRVVDREQLAAAARLAEHALVADLAAALGVERGPVEDDLGLAVSGQLVELHAVADDRDAPGPRPSSSRSRGTSCRRRAPGSRRTARSLGLLRRARAFVPDAAALALLGERQLEAGAVDADAVLGGELDGQVDREAVRVVQPEGDVAGQTGASAGRSSGRRPTTRSASVSAGERRLELDRAGIERPRELRLLAGDDGEDLVAPLDEVRVGLAHDVDDDRGRLGQERLAPAEQPAVADGAAQDAAQDVAAPLVRRQDVVGDEERDGARVVGDDLVAEALGLEGVRDRGRAARASARGSA